MPKSKEYVDSSSAESDSSTEKAPKRKHKSSKEKEEKSEKAQSSKKPKTSSKADEDEPTWEIGKNRYVKIREFKNKMYVDIREMYEDHGELKPGRKGICMDMTQWRKFMEQVEEIDKVAKTKC